MVSYRNKALSIYLSSNNHQTCITYQNNHQTRITHQNKSDIKYQMATLKQQHQNILQITAI